jgi:hypothetical protein
MNVRPIPFLILPGLLVGCAEVPLAPALPERPPPATPLASSDVPGRGQVRLDVVGAPARVELVEQRDYPWGPIDSATASLYGGLLTMRGEHVRPACDATPCLLDMPYGTYEFRFTQGERQDTAFVTFGPTATQGFHAVGSRKDDQSALGILGGVLAGVAVLTIPIGGALAVTDPPPSIQQTPGDRHTTGFVSLGIGVAALAGAIACLSAASSVDRSGPVRQWPAEAPR